VTGLTLGFHAKTADEFAETLHEALSLSADQSMRMRRAARALAVEKFSEARFDQGWEKGWKVLEAKSAARRPRRQA
jgi:alpha-1,2-mannosyltransferase